MTDQQFQDIVHVLQYVLEKIPPKDSVRAAMNRLAPPLVPRANMEELKARRSALTVQRVRLQDKCKHLAELAAKPNAHWSAKRTSDQAHAEYEAVCIELAKVETAIKEAA